jgi:hypothetical protein
VYSTVLGQTRAAVIANAGTSVGHWASVDTFRTPALELVLSYQLPRPNRAKKRRLSWEMTDRRIEQRAFTADGTVYHARTCRRIDDIAILGKILLSFHGGQGLCHVDSFVSTMGYGTLPHHSNFTRARFSAHIEARHGVRGRHSKNRSDDKRRMFRIKKSRLHLQSSWARALNYLSISLSKVSHTFLTCIASPDEIMQYRRHEIKLNCFDCKKGTNTRLNALQWKERCMLHHTGTILLSYCASARTKKDKVRGIFHRMSKNILWRVSHAPTMLINFQTQPT